MNRLEKNCVQFDYFSENYQNFESDFYKYSSLNIPLTFLIDDIIHLMESTGKSYFRLNALNAKDGKDHIFFFSIEFQKENPYLKKYRYLGNQNPKATK